MLSTIVLIHESLLGTHASSSLRCPVLKEVKTLVRTHGKYVFCLVRLNLPCCANYFTYVQYKYQ